MPFTVVVYQEHLGDTGTIFIHGLGTFGNGTHEVSDEDEQNFRMVNTVDVGSMDDDPKSENFGSYIPKWQEGPDLVTASKSMHGVTVTKHGEDTDTGSGDDTGSGTPAGPVGSLPNGAPADSGVGE